MTERREPAYRVISAEEAAALVKARAPDLVVELDADEYRNEDGEVVVRLYEGGASFEGSFSVDQSSGFETILKPDCVGERRFADRGADGLFRALAEGKDVFRS